METTGKRKGTENGAAAVEKVHRNEDGTQAKPAEKTGGCERMKEG
jgi:hypothetical protein